MKKPVIMLWADHSSDPLEAKLGRAADYYAKKYGCRPNKAWVHPSVLGGADSLQVDGILVVGKRYILPYDIHITCEVVENDG